MKVAVQNHLRFEIIEDHPEVGYYLYVYEEGRCIADYLQNDEATCKQVAFDEYGVNPSSWTEVSEAQ